MQLTETKSNILERWWRAAQNIREREARLGQLQETRSRHFALALSQERGSALNTCISRTRLLPEERI